jgi:hypothetical protein
MRTPTSRSLLPFLVVALGMLAAPVARAQVLTYTVGATNATADPVTFQFLFSQTFPAITGPFEVFSTVSYSVTDLDQRGGASITPASPPAGTPEDADGLTEIAVHTLLASFVPTSAGIDLGLGGSTASGTQAFGPFSEVGATAPGAGPYDGMAVTVSFILSPGDEATVSGEFRISPLAAVPEPGTLAFLAGPVLAAGYGLRRRFRKA